MFGGDPLVRYRSIKLNQVIYPELPLSVGRPVLALNLLNVKPKGNRSLLSIVYCISAVESVRRFDWQKISCDRPRALATTGIVTANAIAMIAITTITSRSVN